jgi:hypothetical protein
VEAKAWQAFYAALSLERSKFGLNELLGLALGAAKEKRQKHTRCCANANHKRVNSRGKRPMQLDSLGYDQANSYSKHATPIWL